MRISISPRSEARVLQRWPFLKYYNVLWNGKQGDIFINIEYRRKLVYKLKKFELVIDQEMKLRAVRNFQNLW